MDEQIEKNHAIPIHGTIAWRKKEQTLDTSYCVDEPQKHDSK